jgi:hypothetical protein
MSTKPKKSFESLEIKNDSEMKKPKTKTEKNAIKNAKKKAKEKTKKIQKLFFNNSDIICDESDKKINDHNPRYRYRPKIDLEQKTELYAKSIDILEAVRIHLTKLNKIKLTKEREVFLTTRHWWKEEHTIFNKYLQALAPHTHLVSVPWEESIKCIPKLDTIKFPNKNYLLGQMEPSKCHENCERFYIFNKKREDPLNIKIFTGYALSADRLWRYHSWIMEDLKTKDGSKSERIIETTQERIIYIGYDNTSSFSQSIDKTPTTSSDSLGSSDSLNSTNMSPVFRLNENGTLSLDKIESDPKSSVPKVKSNSQDLIKSDTRKEKEIEKTENLDDHDLPGLVDSNSDEESDDTGSS